MVAFPIRIVVMIVQTPSGTVDFVRQFYAVLVDWTGVAAPSISLQSPTPLQALPSGAKVTVTGNRNRKITWRLSKCLPAEFLARFEVWLEEVINSLRLLRNCHN